jgi:hypothetical protein
MRGAAYSDEEKAYLASPDFSVEGWRQRFPERDIARETLRRKHRFYASRLRDMTPTPLPDGGSLTIDETATITTWREYLQQAERAARDGRVIRRKQQSTFWEAPGNLPVGVVFTGDWHLGAEGVDYDALDAFLLTALTTGGLYAVGMGDYIEGVSPFDKAKGTLFVDAYSDPQAQVKSVSLRASVLKGRWLAWLDGNHDQMMARHVGFAASSVVAEELGAPHFGEGGGTITAAIGDQIYTLAVRHHFGGKSANVPRRMLDEWPEWDRPHVAVMAHLHFNEIQRVSRNGGRAWGLRCGTFKLHDEYAARNGFRPEIGCPMVILMPGEERVLAFAGDDLDIGLETLARLRQEAS